MTEMRRIRRECGISVKALAASVGVTPMSIYRYEQGRRIPDADIAIKMADALECTVEQLLGTKESQEAQKGA